MDLHTQINFNRFYQSNNLLWATEELVSVEILYFGLSQHTTSSKLR